MLCKTKGNAIPVTANYKRIHHQVGLMYQMVNSKHSYMICWFKILWLLLAIGSTYASIMPRSRESNEFQVKKAKYNMCLMAEPGRIGGR